jgi:hypothetical protein
MLGLTKFVLGRPLSEIDSAWNDLAGWWCGVAGLIVGAVAVHGDREHAITVLTPS